MEPQDSTQLGKGTVYIAQDGETLVPLGECIPEATFEPATGGVVVEPCIYAKHEDTVVPLDASASATITANLTKEQYEAFYRLCIKPTLDLWERWRPLVFKLWTMGVTACHYIQTHPRVAYLALHGRTRRIRKKNLHRIIRKTRKD